MADVRTPSCVSTRLGTNCQTHLCRLDSTQQQFTQSLFATLEQTIAPDTQVIKAVRGEFPYFRDDDQLPSDAS